MPRKRDHVATYTRRQARARTAGFRSYGQQRYQMSRLTDNRVRELAEEIGGPVESGRPNSLMSREADRIVNGYGRDKPTRRGDWRVRLLAAAGRL